MNLKYCKEDVIKLLKNSPYTMIEDSFSTLSHNFLATTCEGYTVVLNSDNVLKNKKAKPFFKNNPYTIQNIKKYLINHNIKTVLLSENYECNSKKLVWKCSCGTIFERSWNNFQNSDYICKKCSGKNHGMKNRLSINVAREEIEKRGFYLIEESKIKEIPITLNKIPICDNEGYYYLIWWPDFQKGKNPKRFHPCNPYVIDNINNYLTMYRDTDYTCLSEADEYQNNTSPLVFRHNQCGKTFQASFSEMRGKFCLNKTDKYYKQCPFCNHKKTESNHASILKQIFLHEYSDTIVEEKSCINPNTGYSLPTDIVNHRLKIAIEIQSAYHDTDFRKEVDLFKKNFWLKRGYRFFDPDIREYSILGMVQIFFPDMKELPDYLDYNFSDCTDFIKVQDLLNERHSIKDVAEIMHIKEGTIRGLITSKKIVLPIGYKDKAYNIKPIIQLAKNGKYLNRFSSLAEANRNGYASGTVCRVLKHLQGFAYDSYWVYESDYIDGNYKIPIEHQDKFDRSVMKKDLNNNIVTVYSSIYEAENDSRSNKSEIYRVASGQRKSSRKEKWLFVS